MGLCSRHGESCKRTPCARTYTRTKKIYETHQHQPPKMSCNYLSRYPFALQDKYNEGDLPRDTLCRKIRARTELGDMMMDSFGVDKARFQREFLTPVANGYYYPRYAMTGSLESASAHIPYLARPYYNYATPSKYGYSKHVTVRKLEMVCSEKTSLPPNALLASV